jgi:ferric-dicitrate binding protein FerR (iron transport regulator)
MENADESRAAYRELAQIWRHADPNLPELDAERAAARLTEPAR